MSKCISSHGEYSEHERDFSAKTVADEFTCLLCAVFDEDGAVAEIERLRRELEASR